MRGHVLVARLDNAGDVLLTGPAVRAVAHGASRVSFLAGPAGAAAARMLPGVDDVWEIDTPWTGFDPPETDRGQLDSFVDRVSAAGIDAAVILTSFHQSALPLALLLRCAGVGHIAATSVDYPGSLLDVRHPYLPDLHEVEQALSTCAAAGHQLPPGDDRRMAVVPTTATPPLPPRPYVVVHPGASVPARRLPLEQTAEVVRTLTRRGWTVVLTGTAEERELTGVLAAAGVDGRVDDRTGTTGLDELAHLAAGAEVVVCPNTGTAHLAAAVGTPVVEAFAPVVPAHRWRPWGVPHVLFGDQTIACAGCRARTCPIEGQPCLDPYRPDDVVDAVERMARTRSHPRNPFTDLEAAR